VPLAVRKTDYSRRNIVDGLAGTNLLR
jgi:hypothetical protein